MSFSRWAMLVVVAQTCVVMGGEPRGAYLRPRPWYVRPYRFGATVTDYRPSPYSRSTYRESPYHRERRVLNSPSLYAGPYPAGGLYTWRQWYYDRLRYPLFDRSLHSVFSLLPYSTELSMAQSEASGVLADDEMSPADDPITKLQRAFFTDDAHSAENLLQLKLGY